MQQIPDWVPEEVITYHKQLCAQELRVSKFLKPSDIRVLHRCMKSRAMEKAWQSINKRKEKSDPTKFAKSIIDVVHISRRLPEFYPTLADIAKLNSLLKKSQALCGELDGAFESWDDFMLKKAFGDSPTIIMGKLTDGLSFAVRFTTGNRKSLKTLSGKPQSKTSKRTFVIRVLSREMQRLYGQPLHKVVALTTSEIFKENVDEETVRKLVS